MSKFDVVSITGLISFSEAKALQLELLEKRIRDEVNDTIIICEHKPVITRGRGLQFVQGREERAMPLPIIPEGTEYVEVERGGDLTWHGPGQLVIYPIIKLGGKGQIGEFVGQDVNRYIRFLENQWIYILADFKVTASSKEGGSGVWIGPKKVASVGIALRKWVSYHGIAINIVNDLRPFQFFDPCGFSASVMTRLQDLTPIPADYFTPEWRNLWENLFLEKLRKNLV